MPTGRITTVGGLTSQTIQPPYLPGPNPGTRGASLGVDTVHTLGGTAIVDPEQNSFTHPYGALEASRNYSRLNPSIAKAYFIAPTNQGQRAGKASRQSLMYDPRNSPSRSQFMQGYTPPLQVFASSNTWQIAGATSKGTRAKQPSLKFVSPFGRNPIPVRMPWDL